MDDLLLQVLATGGVIDLPVLGILGTSLLPFDQFVLHPQPRLDQGFISCATVQGLAHGHSDRGAFLLAAGGSHLLDKCFLDALGSIVRGSPPRLGINAIGGIDPHPAILARSGLGHHRRGLHRLPTGGSSVFHHVFDSRPIGGLTRHFATLLPAFTLQAFRAQCTLPNLVGCKPPKIPVIQALRRRPTDHKHGHQERFSKVFLRLRPVEILPYPAFRLVCGWH